MIEISDILIDKIACIRNLWEKLNKLHFDDSVYFEDHFESLSFEKRIEKFKQYSENDLKISIVKDGVKYLGYCISTIDKINGEIESIYLDEELQGRGIGKKLISEHLKWLKESKCTKIHVSVSYGHESAVQDFYHKMGFYERLIYFELKE